MAPKKLEGCTVLKVFFFLKNWPTCPGQKVLKMLWAHESKFLKNSLNTSVDY